MTETDFGGRGPQLTGAWCALHPEQRAESTCTRCGSFMCSTCSEGGAQTLCPSCQQRLGIGQAFPLTRENWNFSALWDYCFEIFKREWLMLGVGVLIFFGIVFIAQLITSIFTAIGGALKNTALSVILSVVGVVMQQVAQGVVGLGLMRMIFDVLQGNKPDLGRLFSQLPKLGTYLVTMLLVVLMIAVPMGAIGGVIGGVVYAMGGGFNWESALPVFIVLGVLLIIPLIYFTIPLSLLQAEIAFNDDATPTQMIRNCYAYARGERLSIFGVSLVGGLVAMAGLVACCVGVLPAIGLSYMLIAGLYLALRNGADVEG
jgi:hypothetical protein